MSAAKKKSSKSASKAPARKAKTTKSAAAPRKKPAKAAARREEAAAPARPSRRASASRKRARPAPAPTGATAPGLDARSRLGAKWACFRCEAKFYDLNRPEPLCPKCGANQNERPKRDPKVKPPIEVPATPPRSLEREREREREMIGEEEEDGLMMEDEELDLGGAEIDGDSDDFGDEEEEEEASD